MNAKKFIDTNVLIYAHDAMPAKGFGNGFAIFLITFP
jgi:predicted nucleic acid-binding protein